MFSSLASSKTLIEGINSVPYVLCEVERCFIDAVGFWMFSISGRYFLDASGGIINQLAASSATIFSAFSVSSLIPELSSVSATDAPGSEDSLS